MKLSGRAAVVAATALLWLVLMLVGTPSYAAILASFAAFGLGAAVVAGWPAVGALVDRGLQELDAMVRGEESPVRVEAPVEPEPDVAEAVMNDVLTTLAQGLAARRMVVWAVDRERDVVAPEHVLGPAPAAGRAAGNPLTWTVEERSPLRIEPAPSWARGDVVAAPVDAHRALSVEANPGEAPEPETLQPAAEILAAVLRLVDLEVDARAERERLHRVTGFLQGLSSDPDPEQVPAVLAGAAIDLVGGRGAVVASWDGEEGVVLTREGEVDGPEPGRAFSRGDGDLAHAGRAGATVRRVPTDAGERPPLADAGEAWNRTAPYRVAVPLVDPGGAVGGLVAIWGDAPPVDEGVRLLEALGPLLSIHLQQATDLVRFRDRATLDALTGLPNRAAFDERMAEEQARFHRYRTPAALMVVDLDHFKHVNDTHGHEAGDAVLRAVAEVLRSAIRDVVDVPARYGGEEMVVLMEQTLVHAAGEVAERVRVAIEAARVEHEGVVIPVTASIGVSGCPERVDEPAALFDSADQALYRAKESGRNRVVVAERTTNNYGTGRGEGQGRSGSG